MRFVLNTPAASTPYAGAEFGCSIAIDGDGTLVGAHNDDEAALIGAAFLYEDVGDIWVETAKYVLADAAPSVLPGPHAVPSGDCTIVGAEWSDDPALDRGELWGFTNSADVRYRPHGFS